MSHEPITLLQSSSNPFATRFVRPGALAYRFPAGDSLDLFRRRLAEAHWQGQIVGPHGSGKTTLLRTLDRHWGRWGRVAHTWTLRAGQRRLSVARTEVSQWDAQTQLIVDGYEQLSLTSCWWLSYQCRRVGCGLLVTSHRARGKPTVLETRMTSELACDLVRVLLRPEGGPPGISDPAVIEAFEQECGNLREVFFRLYDLWE